MSGKLGFSPQIRVALAIAVKRDKTVLLVSVVVVVNASGLEGFVEFDLAKLVNESILELVEVIGVNVGGVDCPVAGSVDAVTVNTPGGEDEEGLVVPNAIIVSD